MSERAHDARRIPAERHEDARPRTAQRVRRQALGQRLYFLLAEPGIGELHRWGEDALADVGRAQLPSGPRAEDERVWVA